MGIAFVIAKKSASVGASSNTGSTQVDCAESQLVETKKIKMCEAIETSSVDVKHPV